MGFFPPDHKFATDTASTFTQEESDRFYSPGKQLKDGDSHEVIVCGGFDTGHVISGYKYFKSDGQPHTCLLYTSPSPRDATLSRMPASA